MLLDGRTKGLPAGIAAVQLEAVGGCGFNVLREDLPLPLAVLKSSSLAHNASWMRAFLELTGVRLAPHGKTSMSPELFRRQLDDGAWGITVATVQQLRVCRQHGIRRILMANQLVGRQAIRYVLDELAHDPDFEFFTLADSIAGVEMLANAALERNAGRPLNLLVELGVRGGRTGCRSVAEALAVANRIAQATPHLRLAGVEGYEGAVPGATPEDKEANIATFVDALGQVAIECEERGLFDAGSVILSAGGSAYFDMVTRLPREVAGRHAEIVIRSGCYLTHDSDSYADAARRMLTRMPQLAALGDGLRDAIEIFAYVQSRPEPDLAILALGKRDVSHDLHLPFARTAFRPGHDVRPRPLAPGCAVTALNDQHAYLHVPAGEALAVGDVVGCSISHPCTTFDKWRFLPIVNDDYDVVDAVATWF
jgi:D-serine dehydratase